MQGWFHDSWFTDEARYLFTHTGAFTLQFYGDDDMFIFINGNLVIDLVACTSACRAGSTSAPPAWRQSPRADR